MRLSSSAVPRRPVVPIGELSPVQRRVVQTLIAGASMAAAGLNVIPNNMKMDPAAVVTSAGSGKELSRDRGTPS